MNKPSSRQDGLSLLTSFIMVIAAPILNLTVVVWQALRAGLGKIRSKKASKK